MMDLIKPALAGAETGENTDNPVKKRRQRLESQLLFLAAVFLGLLSAGISLNESVRERTWRAEFPWEHWIAFLVWTAGIILAHYYLNRRLPSRDPYLLPIAGLLSGWGLLVIWRLYPYFGIRQTVWLGIGFGLLILGLRLNANLNFLRRYKYIWLTSGLILTGATLLFGTNPLGYGPPLWLGCCGIYLQPSEPLKLLLIIYLAAYFADYTAFRISASGTLKSSQPAPKMLQLLAPTVIMASLALLILIVQRDLGTASIFILLYAVMVFLVSGRKRYLIIGTIILFLAGLAGYAAFDLIRLRIDAWINPWLDPSGRSYQVVQSLLAIANGGVAGRGPGVGSPGLVPIPHSDFIFSSITEEWGLFGAIALLILIGLFAQRGIVIATRASNSFHRLLASGLTAYITLQSILIIGGNIRMLPLTGVTLPFVSYGGSSLVVSFIALLLLIHISSLERVDEPDPASVLPIQQMGFFLLIGIGLLALITGWWTVIQGPDLLTRTDNARRGISDQYVKRGSILDRDNNPINQSSGEIGSYTRNYLYPELSPVVGYVSPIYGITGIEATMDATLRGLQGNPGLSIWYNHLLYGQPPPGVDIRTSLDLDVQQIADETLGDYSGAMVILNPLNGEILAMASHPTFDANSLEENWSDIISDPASRLVNRATQGLYPSGTVLGPVLYAASQSAGTTPVIEGGSENDLLVDCSLPPEDASWGALISNGCPAAYEELLSSYGRENFNTLINDLGLESPPAVRLPLELGEWTGDQTTRISPLQLALALSPISNNGVIPGANIITAINTPNSGWSIQPKLEGSKPVLPALTVQGVVKELVDSQIPIWENVSTIEDPLNPGSQVSWYTAGTTSDWIGTPLIVVFMLENQDAELVSKLGQQFFNQMIPKN